MAMRSKLGPRCCICLLVLMSMTLGAQANLKIDDSCMRVESLDANGRVLEKYGDLVAQITSMVQEVGAFAKHGYRGLVGYEQGKLDRFDDERVRRAFFAFQGDAWRKRHPNQPESRRPERAEAQHHVNWKDVKKNLAEMKELLFTDDDTVRIVCGDSRLEKWWIDSKGRYVKQKPPREKRQGFVYRDPLQLRLGGEEFWQPNDLSCRDKPGKIRAVGKMQHRYLQLCPWFINPNTARYTIGDDRTTDWGRQRYNGRREQSLDYWASQYVSYVTFHELFHIVCFLEDVWLCPSVWSEEEGLYLEKAYRMLGVLSLVEQDYELAPGNVDNNAYIALAIYLSESEWSTGRAVSRRVIESQVGR